MSFWFLFLLVTLGNLAIGFCLGVHLGFGPDFSRWIAMLRKLQLGRRGKNAGDGLPPIAHR